ncbi:MAG: glycoside hydrolase family 18 protein [Bacteroidota bacterium]
MIRSRIITALLLQLFILFGPTVRSENTSLKVIGYYAGNTVPFDSIDFSSLTHVIYCFGTLCGDDFCLRSQEDTIAIRQLVELKSRHPKLKVMLSLGGWGGCATCSDVFSSEKGRGAFAESVKQVTRYFGVDGLDLDWEYPVVKGFPGHKRSMQDKYNFTALLESIRKVNGDDFILSFAAGGYTDFIDSAIAWKEVCPLVDFINVMSYDLVHGYSTVSGHHTPLYSTTSQLESTSNAVTLLTSRGVPAEKIIIGAAFYARVFKTKDGYPVELYQPCVFDHTFKYSRSEEVLAPESGYQLRFDSTAFAPYAVNESDRLLATFDNPVSITEKTRYAIRNHLGGIMFWQLCDDKPQSGLLEVIRRTLYRD